VYDFAVFIIMVYQSALTTEPTYHSETSVDPLSLPHHGTSHHRHIIISSLLVGNLTHVCRVQRIITPLFPHEHTLH
jgi:hypothetical protein